MKYLLILILLSTQIFAKGIYESSIIDYENRPADNKIEALKDFLQSQQLEYHPRRGYLDSALKN